MLLEQPVVPHAQRETEDEGDNVAEDGGYDDDGCGQANLLEPFVEHRGDEHAPEAEDCVDDDYPGFTREEGGVREVPYGKELVIGPGVLGECGLEQVGCCLGQDCYQQEEEEGGEDHGPGGGRMSQVHLFSYELIILIK